MLQGRVPASHSASRFTIFVLNAGPEIDLDLLKPGARPEMLEDSSVETWPTCDTPASHLHVDDIPRILAHGPGRFEVEWGVEIAVLWDIGRLYWRKVNTDYEGIRVFVRNLDAPDTCSTAQVEDLGPGRVWCIEQAILGPCHREQFVEDIETVLFFLVARERVDSFPVAMV